MAKTVLKKKTNGAKPGAKASSSEKKTSYVLEARSSDITPATIYGKVTENKEGFRIVYKRPRSSKVDTFIIPVEHVLAAQIGDDGWLITDHPDFRISLLDVSLVNAEITDDCITGDDSSSGAFVWINKKLVKMNMRKASYAE